MDVLRWQGRKRGLLDIGYHIIVDRDGAIHRVRDVGCVGSHTPGYNHLSVGVCLIGGRNANGQAEDNFTATQKATLVVLLAAFLTEWPQARIAAHHELRGYSGRQDGYRCPQTSTKVLDELRRAAREGAALGCRTLTQITTGRKAAQP